MFYVFLQLSIDRRWHTEPLDITIIVLWDRNKVELVPSRNKVGISAPMRRVESVIGVATKDMDKHMR